MSKSLYDQLLRDDALQRPTTIHTTSDSPTDGFLEALRRCILEQLEIAAKDEQLDHVVCLYWRHLNKHPIWHNERRSARAVESIRNTGAQYIKISDGRYSVIRRALILLTSRRHENGLWYEDKMYKKMVIRGLLSVYLGNRSTLDIGESNRDKIMFSLYAMGQILPYHSFCGGPGLATYVELANLLANLDELGFGRYAALLQSSTAEDPEVDGDDEEYDFDDSALEEVISFKDQAAFFTCADLFLHAGTWLEENFTSDIAKRLGADSYYGEFYSGRFLYAALSAFSEDRGWQFSPFALTKDEKKGPIRTAGLQRRAWSEFERYMTIREMMTLVSRSKDRDRIGNFCRKDWVEDVEKVVDLVQARMASFK